MRKDEEYREGLKDGTQRNKDIKKVIKGKRIKKKRKMGDTAEKHFFIMCIIYHF